MQSEIRSTRHIRFKCMLVAIAKAISMHTECQIWFYLIYAMLILELFITDLRTRIWPGFKQSFFFIMSTGWKAFLHFTVARFSVYFVELFTAKLRGMVLLRSTDENVKLLCFLDNFNKHVCSRSAQICHLIRWMSPGKVPGRTNPFKWWAHHWLSKLQKLIQTQLKAEKRRGNCSVALRDDPG